MVENGDEIQDVKVGVWPSQTPEREIRFTHAGRSEGEVCGETRRKNKSQELKCRSAAEAAPFKTVPFLLSEFLPYIGPIPRFPSLRGGGRRGGS